MDDNPMRHGCLLTSLIVVAWPAVARAAIPPADDLVPIAQTQQFDVAYTINREAQPLDKVTLWYTFDEATTWHNFGADEDLVSPISFAAPREGLCGLYFVATNEAGVSSPAPTSDTSPQLWVMIDYTPPVAQLHPPVIDQRPGGQTVIRVNWTALDAQLASRPIDLAYRVLPDGEWKDARRRMSNSGRYDWRVPDDAKGRIMLRLTVRDRGGHTTHSASSAIDLSAAASADAAGESDRIPTDGAAPRPPLSPEDMQRARDLLRKGRYHQLRAEHDLAAARLRDALKIDPDLTEALVRLGASLYALNLYEESASAFELSLEQKPNNREGLEGLARSLIALKKYDAAETKLRAIVDRRPDDVETWLHLGDVAIYRGDEIDAREYYQKAATLRPRAIAVVDRAKARLDDLAALSRNRHGQTSP